MEVHQHTHPAIGGTRKKWSHYFWEFLMLFLAVFCGFLAENQREHVIEHQRAKVYAANLNEELKKDTARLNYLITRLKFISSKLDTFCLYSKEKKQQNITPGMLYYYASYVTNVSYFSPHDATIEQLKGSGNLRIMSNKTAHEISEYDNKIRELEREYSLSNSEFEKIETLHFKIFDLYLMETLLPDPDKIDRDSIFLDNALEVRKDDEMMKEYTGWIKFEANIYTYQIKEFLEPLKQKAESLLELLKKEYHLK